METAGYLLAALGGLMTLSGIHLGFTKYNLHDPHEFSVFTGGLILSFLMLAGGLLMVERSKKKKRPPPMP